MKYYLLVYTYLLGLVCLCIGSAAGYVQDMDNCPNSCRCRWAQNNFSLTVNCEQEFMDTLQFEQHIRDIIEDTREIQHLTIHQTPLVNIDNLHLSVLDNLQYISFTNNAKLTKLSEPCFANLSKLQSAQLSGNNIHQIDSNTFKHSQQLLTLILRHNHISTIPSELFNHLKVLKTLDLRNNSLVTLQHHMFTNMSNLKFIYLSYNNISIIPPHTFLNLSSIHEIHLDFNQLTSIDIWPIYLAVKHGNGFHAKLNNNKISKFTNHLQWMYDCSMPPADGQFDLSENKIHHLNDILLGYESTDLSALCLFKGEDYKIHLENNYLDCDCIDVPILTLLSKVAHLGLREYLYCNTPKSWYDTKVFDHPLNDFVCDVIQDCPPHCKCLQRPHNITVHVQCNGSHLAALPEKVPMDRNMSNYKYVLRFDHNNIVNLDSKSYFVHASEADFSHNRISMIDINALFTFTNLNHLYLNNNNITKFPRPWTTFEATNLTSIHSISLHNNPWSCLCADQWFHSFLIEHRHQLLSDSGILCQTPVWLKGNNILQLKPQAFCENPQYHQNVLITLSTLAAVIGTAVLLGVPFTILYKKRVWVYKQFNWHPFDCDECDGEDKHFDAFVSYSNQDESWVIHLINQLEEVGFKINFHRRDFHGGQPIIVNVEEAIERSKRCIFVMTNAFLESSVCVWEFDTALSHAVQEGRTRVIMIKCGDLAENLLPLSIRQYMRRHSYIERDSAAFMDNLLYSLPTRKLGRTDSTNEETQPLLGSQ